ncbi:MAG: thiamine phosphate synthase [Alphaproteobacteria bacterium]|nr:thiamine phosphate synthase [Alphaproteobacteria bacterium]
MTFHAATLAEIAAGLNRDHSRTYGQRGKLPQAFFITDQQAVARPQTVIATLPMGCAVIFRDYDHPAREKLGAALSLSCAKRGVPFLVAGDEPLATALQADGIHLPEAQMDQVVKIRAAHPRWIITLSCHDPDAVCRAADLPVDAGLIAPVFPTLSHPETGTGAAATLGLAGVTAMVRQTTLPLFALGGIGPENIHQLIGLGLAGIAAIRGFAEIQDDVRTPPAR